MAGEPVNVLFICPNNACRSIMAETLLNKLGQGRFVAFSAGPKPKGQISPYVAETLQQVGYDTTDLRSKHWDMFVTPSSPRLDVVVTLCDSLKDIRMPIWYSNPVRVHWGFSNPEEVEGEDQERVAAFRRCYGDLEQLALKMAALASDGIRGRALAQLLEAIKP
ncbi:MAG: arsenate reductase ArsC [Magnetovibrio sp.]|nr:arsenate reductase ArsC [Magnetovibrio sp.]